MIREAVLAVGVVALAACVVDFEPSPGRPLPADYRQMFAQYVVAYARTKRTLVIHDAFISKPFDRPGNLLRGSTMTAVCVRVIVENKLLFGHISPSDFFMTVKDGQVDDLSVETDPCTDLSPFPELMQLIQR
jgi:hypothetical protein